MAKKQLPDLEVNSNTLIEIAGVYYTRDLFISSVPFKLKHSAQCLWEGIYLFYINSERQKPNFDENNIIIKERK